MNVYEHLLPIDSHFDLIGQDTTSTQMHFYFISRSQSACCPNCQKPSMRRHSYTKRKIRDLPILGKEVSLHLRLKKWFCLSTKCNKIIFTETIDAAPTYQRNTTRVTKCLHELAFRTNCVQAAKLSKTLCLSVSHDTLLRLIYETPMPTNTSPFLAIDDFAFRKGDVYGTIICDLRTNRPIALLNGRDFSTVADWLKAQSKLYVVARDGSNTYKSAITAASPNILQISDRFHLVLNLFKTMKDALTRLLPSHINMHKEQDKAVVSAITPTLSSKVEGKWKLIQEVKQAFKNGISQREIARNFKMRKNIVKKYVEIEQSILYKREEKESMLILPFYQLIQERTLSGTQITIILKEIESLGFKGSYSTF